MNATVLLSIVIAPSPIPKGYNIAAINPLNFKRIQRVFLY